MRQKIKHYRNPNSTPPHQNNIEEGEIAIGFKTGEEKLFMKNTDNEIVEFRSKQYVDNIIPKNVSELINDIGFITSADIPSSDILTHTVISDANGIVDVPVIEGYRYMNSVAFDRDLPLNVIRFGNYYYVGYYGGQEEPNGENAITLMFTAKANITVYIYYIKISE